jgi:hypothetical protein
LAARRGTSVTLPTGARAADAALAGPTRPRVTLFSTVWPGLLTRQWIALERLACPVLSETRGSARRLALRSVCRTARTGANRLAASGRGQPIKTFPANEVSKRHILLSPAGLLREVLLHRLGQDQPPSEEWVI